MLGLDVLQRSKKQYIDSNDWSIIDSLLQDLVLEQNQLLSKDLSNKLEQKLKEQVQEEIITMVKRLALTIK